MEQIFKEKREVGALPTPKSRAAAIVAEVRAAYDDKYGVLCIDLEAHHMVGCEDDGTPSGCRFCAPQFPVDRRLLVDLGDVVGSGTSVAIRRAVVEADEWYAECQRALAQNTLAMQQPAEPADG